jgi:hypothetical protein
MARVGFSLEKLLEITKENSLESTQVLFGTAVPGGDTGEQDDAPIGSLYIKTGTFDLYQKLADANAAADWFNYGSLYSVLGISKGDVNMGNYTGGILTNGQSVKTNIQELIDYINTILDEQLSSDGVTTVEVLDDEVVDDVLAVEYDVVISLFDDETQRVALKIYAVHDGTPSADAVNIDDVVFSKLKFGAAFNYTLSMGLSGAGAAQKMELKIASTETNGVNIRAAKVKQVNA